MRDADLPGVADAAEPAPVGLDGAQVSGRWSRCPRRGPPHQGHPRRQAFSVEVLGSLEGGRKGNELRVLSNWPDGREGGEGEERGRLGWNFQLTKKPGSSRVCLSVRPCAPVPSSSSSRRRPSWDLQPRGGGRRRQWELAELLLWLCRKRLRQGADERLRR